MKNNETANSKQQTANRKYYLHRKVKQIGLKIDKPNRTISSKYEKFLNYKYCKMLSKEYGYNLQLSIA